MSMCRRNGEATNVWRLWGTEALDGGDYELEARRMVRSHFRFVDDDETLADEVFCNIGLLQVHEHER